MDSDRESNDARGGISQNRASAIIWVIVETNRCWGRIVSEDSGSGACDSCVEICPEVFEKPEPDRCARVRQDVNPGAYAAQIRHAVRKCPVDAIRVIEIPADVDASQAYKWVPVIDEERCTGCGLCVEACGPNCLEIVDGIAVLTRPDQCGSEEHCIPACHDDAIHMAWVPLQGNGNVGKWKAIEHLVREANPHTSAPSLP